MMTLRVFMICSEYRIAGSLPKALYAQQKTLLNGFSKNSCASRSLRSADYNATRMSKTFLKVGILTKKVKRSFSSFNFEN